MTMRDVDIRLRKLAYDGQAFDLVCESGMLIDHRISYSQENATALPPRRMDISFYLEGAFHRIAVVPGKVILRVHGEDARSVVDDGGPVKRGIEDAEYHQMEIIRHRTEILKHSKSRDMQDILSDVDWLLRSLRARRGEG